MKFEKINFGMPESGLGVEPKVEKVLKEIKSAKSFEHEMKNIDAKLKAISKENKLLTSNLESLSSKLDEMILKATSNPRNLMRQKKLDEQKKAENDKKFQLEIKYHLYHHI